MRKADSITESKKQSKVIKVELSEPQNEIIQARAAIIGNIAGQGAGKTKVIGLITGYFIQAFPEAKGFIGANTIEQLSSSTLSRVFEEWETVYGWSAYDKNTNPGGFYVVGQRPPNIGSWKKPRYKFKNYNSIISFKNGCSVFMGALTNYKAHDGKEFTWAHLDETKDTPERAVKDVILGRLRQVGLWLTPNNKPIWSPMITNEIAQRQGLRSWNPLYIHSSPAEGTVEWLINLLGIKDYQKEILETVTKRDDYFFKYITVRDDKGKVLADTAVCIYSSFWNEDNLPSGFIGNKLARSSKSEALKFIYGYPFGRNGGEYFPAFDRFKFVGDYPYKKGLPIFTSWDFNATPYVTLLCAHVEYINRWYDAKTGAKYDERIEGAEQIEVLRITFFREYCMVHPRNRTEDTAEQFALDYESESPDVFAYGDASGHSRIEGLGALTQYKMIENVWRSKLYLNNGWLRAKRKNMQVQKRKDFMNKLFEQKLPEVEILIDASCENLIRDCEYLLEGKDGGKHKETEKDANGIEFQKLGHPADAMEYLVCEVCSEYIKN